jgi:hypothetical protein
MPLLIAVLLGLSGLIVVIYPLLGLDHETLDALPGAPIAEVAEREQSARDALREVEFDHRLGNLDDADYQALRTRYERRALTALKIRYQREQELDALIEQQLDALRLRESATTPVDSEGVQPTQTRNVPDVAVSASRPTASHGENQPARGPQARRRRGGRA